MATHPSGTREKPRVLVVEDDEELRSLLCDHFVSVGYHVEAAADGNEGIERALGLHPDVVVIDVMLPRLDGWQVARTLRAYPSTRGAILVAYTGVGLATARAASAGFDAVLKKPCSPDEVERVVRALRDRSDRHVEPGKGSVA